MKRILIIDDEAEICILLSLLLQDKGFQVQSAGSLKEAREELAHFHPDLVLLDLNLLDGFGFDLVPHLQTMKGPPEIIVISAYGDLIQKSRAGELGIQHYVPKPFRNESLFELIDELLPNNNPQ